VTVENLESVLPCRCVPSLSHADAAHLTIIDRAGAARTQSAISAGLAKSYPLHVTERTTNLVKAEFFGYNVALSEDLAIHYARDAAQADSCASITEREGTEDFFPRRRCLVPVATGPGRADHPRTVIERSTTLFPCNGRNWSAASRLRSRCCGACGPWTPSICCCSIRTFVVRAAPVAATRITSEQALAFIRNSRIRGGTDLQLRAACRLAQAAKAGGQPYIVLLSDGGSTDGIVHNAKLAAWYTAEWSKLPDARRRIRWCSAWAMTPMSRC